MCSPVMTPLGPLRKPSSAHGAPPAARARPSNRPAMTEWPPAAWPPLSTTPTRSPAARSAVPAPPTSRCTVGLPYVAGNSAAMRAPSDAGDSVAPVRSVCWPSGADSAAGSGTAYASRAACAAEKRPPPAVEDDAAINAGGALVVQVVALERSELTSCARSARRRRALRRDAALSSARARSSSVSSACIVSVRTFRDFQACIS